MDGSDGSILRNNSEEVGMVAVSMTKIMGLIMNLELYQQ